MRIFLFIAVLVLPACGLEASAPYLHDVPAPEGADEATEEGLQAIAELGPADFDPATIHPEVRWVDNVIVIEGIDQPGRVVGATYPNCRIFITLDPEVLPDLGLTPLGHELIHCVMRSLGAGDDQKHERTAWWSIKGAIDSAITQVTTD